MKEKQPDYIIICKGRRMGQSTVQEIQRIVAEQGGMTPALARMIRREFGLHVYSLPDYHFWGKFLWEFWR